MSEAVHVGEDVILPHEINVIGLAGRQHVEKTPSPEIARTVEDLINVVRARCELVIDKYFSGLTEEAERNGIDETTLVDFLKAVKEHIFASASAHATFKPDPATMNINLHFPEEGIELLKMMMPILQIMKRALSINRETQIRIGALERELNNALITKLKVEEISPADRDDEDRRDLDRAKLVLEEKEHKKGRLEGKMQRLIKKTDELHRKLTANPVTLHRDTREFLEFLLQEGWLENAREIEKLLEEPDEIFNAVQQLVIMREPSVRSVRPGGRTLRLAASLVAAALTAVLVHSFVIKKEPVSAQHDKSRSVTIVKRGKNFRIEQTPRGDEIVLTPSREEIPDDIGEIERSDLSGEIGIPNPKIKLYQKMNGLQDIAEVRGFVERITKRNIIEHIRETGPTKLRKGQQIKLGNVLQDDNAFVVVPTVNFAVATITDLMFSMENGEELYKLVVHVRPIDFPEWNFTWRFQIVGIKNGTSL